MSMQDPVELVREFISKNKPVQFDAEKKQVLFGDLAYDGSGETCFTQHGKSGQYYTLEAVWFVCQHREKPWAAYFPLAQKWRFQMVSFLDYTDMVPYLKGEQSRAALIEKGKIDETHTWDAASRPSATKRAKVDDKGKEEEEPQEQEQEQEEGKGNDAGADDEKEDGGVRPMDVAQDDAYEPGSMVFDDEDEEGGEGASRPTSVRSEASIRKKAITEQAHEEEIKLITEKSAVKRAQLTSDRVLVEALEKEERSLKTRDSLFASNTNYGHLRNYIKVRQLMLDYPQHYRSAQPSRRSSSSGGSRRIDKNLVPIILVPAAATCKISLLNCPKFLGEGVWVSPQEAKKNAGPSSQKLKKQGFFRKVDEHGKVLYEVADTTHGWKSEHWKRVVAIFCVGREWQFKGREWRLGRPEEMFTGRVCGFYLKFKHEKTPPVVSTWNVHVLELDKKNRHGDLLAQRTFWKIIDSEGSRLKPKLVLK